MDVSEAKDRNERIKLIASASKVDGGVDLEVSPTRIPMANPLANIIGVTNALTFTTDCLGDVTIVGPGAGRRATGYSLLTDLISISRG
jgi:homoserine dehydrogenase